jgi:hypothetical protein
VHWFDQILLTRGAIFGLELVPPDEIGKQKSQEIIFVVTWQVK